MNNKNYLFGKNAILDAIKNKQNIIIIKATSNHLKFLKQLNLNYEIVNKSFFNQFQLNHQEIIAYLGQNVINKISIDDLIKQSNDFEKVVMLDSINDPYNFGAIIRSCVAFGIKYIIYKKHNQACINDQVIKTSMGAINYINLCEVSNLSYAIDKLKKNNYWIYSSSLAKNSIDINKIKTSQRMLIILGNENKGISNLILQKSDFLFKIPMTDLVQSLNVSVACGIILSNLFNKG